MVWCDSGARGTALSVLPLSQCCSSSEQITANTDRVFVQISFSPSHKPPFQHLPRTLNILPGPLGLVLQGPSVQLIALGWGLMSTIQQERVL